MNGNDDDTGSSDEETYLISFLNDQNQINYDIILCYDIIFSV